MSLRQINNHLQQYLGNTLVGILALLLAGCFGSSPVQDDEGSPPVSNNPKLNAEFNRAVKVLRAGDNKRAFRLFTAITKKYPRYSGAHVNIGLAYLKTNQLNKATDAFKKALDINKKNAVAYNGLGVVFRRQGKFQDAEQAYHQALSINNNYAIAHLNIGILNDIYFDRPGKALEHYQQYVANSKNADNRVKKWIIDVQRRSKTAQATTNANPVRKRGGKK